MNKNRKNGTHHGIAHAVKGIARHFALKIQYQQNAERNLDRQGMIPVQPLDDGGAKQHQQPDAPSA